MSRKSITQRGRTRVWQPQQLGATAGSTQYILLEYNFAGFPLFLPDGRPTGYPVNPPGFVWNLVWQPWTNISSFGGTSGSTGESPDSYGSFANSAGIFSQGLGFTHGTMNYTGPMVNVNLHTEKGGPVATTFIIEVQQDGVDILNTAVGSGPVDTPFVINAGAGSLIDVQVTIQINFPDTGSTGTILLT